MNVKPLKKVMSFVVVESEAIETVNQRFLVNAGYKLAEKINVDGKVKHVYAWDNEYGVYLYWDEDFIDSLSLLSKKFKVSGLMWDSNIGLIWFNSEDVPVYGLFNMNTIVDDELRSANMKHVVQVLNVLNDEEQSLLCLTVPWMSGFFSNIQMLVNIGRKSL